MLPLQPALQRFQETLNGEGHRLHFTNKLLRRFRNKKQKSDDKPQGLWYGIDFSWAEWCFAEEFDRVGTYIYEIIVNEERILKINNLRQFDAFEKKYRQLPHYVKENNLLIKTLSDAGLFDAGDYGFNFFAIDYEEVAKEFGGIEINPYFYQRRLNTKWYYTWDCASGCVWDRTAVNEVVLLAKYDKEKDEFVRP